MDNKLDSIDFAILGELREDCKLGHKQLADILGIHHNTVIKRIKKLEDEGVIKGYGIEADYTKVGYTMPAIVTMRLKKAGIGDEKLLSNEIRNPNIASLFGVTGINDCISFVRAKDRYDLINVIQEISKNKKIVKTNTDIIMAAHKYPYAFNPFKKVDFAPRSPGKSRKNYDHVDLMILNEMRKNCKQSSRKLSSKLGIHHNTITQRIKRLENDNTILKHRAWIDFRKAGYNLHAIITMKLKKDEFGGPEFVESMIEIPEVEAFYSTTGLYDCCALVRAKNDDDMLRVLRMIGDVKMVSKTTTSMILAEYKNQDKFNPLVNIR